jgi:hypothetical protein
MSATVVNDYCGEKKSKRRKRGRPRLPPGKQMTVRRGIGLRPTEAACLDSLARKAGKSFNVWARDILLTAAGVAQ